MSERLTDEQIAELERLEREANEWCGPTWESMDAPDPDLRLESWLRTPMRDDGSATLVAVDMAPECARLAAAVRNALPSLLAEVRASRVARARTDKETPDE